MPKMGYTPRTLALTQKAETLLCEVCGGVGAVLAVPVTQAHAVEIVDFSGGKERTVSAYTAGAMVRDDAEALIPCPGCFTHQEIT